MIFYCTKIGLFNDRGGVQPNLFYITSLTIVDVNNTLCMHCEDILILDIDFADNCDW